LLLVFAGVAVAFLGRMIIGVAGIAWVTRRAKEIEDDSLVRDFDRACEVLGVERFVRLLSSDSVNVPLMWGIKHPALLLPAQSLEWSRARLRVIFLHELAHLRRLDAATLLITRGATALYWFHPLAWSLDRAARRECEQACDDLVLASGTRASDYADHLLEIPRSLPRHDPFGAVTLAMSRRSQLEGRLLSILQPHASRGSVSRRAAAIAAIVAALIVIPIAAIRLTAQPVPPQQPQIAHAEISVVAHKQDHAEGAEWFEHGVKAYHEGKLAETVEAYQKAIENGYKPATAMYNIACTYAIHGDKENAIHWFEKSIDAGFDQSDTIENDDDLDIIRSDSRFQHAASRVTGNNADHRLHEA